MLPLAPATVLALAATAADLSARASASTAPPACRSREGAWQTPHAGATPSFCDRLAQANAKLDAAPDRAYAAAKALREDFGKAPEPLAVMARAALRMGDLAQAWQLWGEARAGGLDLQAPRLQLDYARSASAAGELALALEHYRQLAARLATWREDAARRRIVLEAASTAARAGAPAAEVAGYAASALRGTPPLTLQVYARGELAWLAFQRSDFKPPQLPRPSEAAARWLSRAAGALPARTGLPRVARAELQAVASFAIEPFDAERALELWQGYVAHLGVASTSAAAGPGEAWRERAQQRTRQLEERAR